MGNFRFLHTEWPDIYREAGEAEGLVFTSPKACAIICRSALEKVVRWLYAKRSSSSDKSRTAFLLLPPSSMKVESAPIFTSSAEISFFSSLKPARLKLMDFRKIFRSSVNPASETLSGRPQV